MAMQQTETPTDANSKKPELSGLGTQMPPLETKIEKDPYQIKQKPPKRFVLFMIYKTEKIKFFFKKNEW